MDNTALRTRLSEKLQARKSEPMEERMIKMEKTSIASADTGYVALKTNALDVITENLKNQPLSLSLFDVVKSPSGGAKVFSVPGLSGEEAEKELTGIILDYTTPRAYWDTPDPVEGTPPVCFSPNSLVSHDGKPCSRCPYNDFGSNGKEDSNAKACKESVMLFLLRPGSILPLLVRVPVTSKLIFQLYLTRLIGKMVPLSSVVTRITLEKATSKGGKPYALYNFEAVDTLPPEATDNARTFGKKFMELLNAAEMEAAIAEVS